MRRSILPAIFARVLLGVPGNIQVEGFVNALFKEAWYEQARVSRKKSVGVGNSKLQDLLQPHPASTNIVARTDCLRQQGYGGTRRYFRTTFHTRKRRPYL